MRRTKQVTKTTTGNPRKNGTRRVVNTTTYYETNTANNVDNEDNIINSANMENNIINEKEKNIKENGKIDFNNIEERIENNDDNLDQMSNFIETAMTDVNEMSKNIKEQNEKFNNLTSKTSNDDENNNETQEYVENQQKPTKKKPGRPPKKPQNNIRSNLGIVNKPITSDSPDYPINMELLYENPILFKKTFYTLYNKEGVGNMIITFDRDTIKFYGKGNKGKSELYTVLYGNKMSYYIKEPYVIKVSHDKIRSVFQAINKDHNKIYLRSIEFEKHMTLYIELISFKKDPVTKELIQKSGKFNIGLAHLSEEDSFTPIEDIIIDEQTYPLSFKLPSKELKTEITTAINMKCTNMHITKKKDTCIYFTFPTSDKEQLSQECDFGNNEDTLDLIYKPLKKNNILDVGIEVNKIKPISTSSISDYIHFSVDDMKDLIFTIYLDQSKDLNKEPIPNSEVGIIKILAPLTQYQSE